MKITKEQVENIQIDYGIVYTNHGETDVALMGPCRGGGEFTVDNKVRDIEYDGTSGKTKGLQVVEEINAALKITVLDTSIKTIALSMPYATLTGDGSAETPYSITCKSTSVGVLKEESYLKNVTMFCKTIKGEYRKIILYNALHEGKFNLKAKPKGEGEIEIEFNAHWDPTDDEKDLYKIETVVSITV